MILSQNHQSNCNGPMFCELDARGDGIIASSLRWYYEFIGTNSMMPFFDVVCDEDKEAIQKDIAFYASADADDSRTEYITNLYNYSEKITRNVFVTLSRSTLTENGVPLCHITIIDFNTQLDYALNYQNMLAKYRYFMTIKNEIYFDYFIETGLLSVYQYNNERSVRLYEGPLDGFFDSQRKEYGVSLIGLEQAIAEVRSVLLSGAKNYDKTFTLVDAESGADVACRILGGTPLFSSDYFFGIFVPNPIADHLPYYLTPAGRDPGTGLFNKRAVTEYAIEMIKATPKSGWLLVIDIDDFKNINDTQGHLYGDDVIKAVAETISTTIGIYGITGRYGGDEFVVFIDEDLTREDVKDLLKVITKRIYLRFDPEVHVTLSIGICHYPDHASSFEELFQKADKSLYIAKDKGKNRHIIYDPELHDDAVLSGNGTRSLTYIINKEQRRKFLTSIMGQLYEKRLVALSPQTGNLRTLRELFDLDGIFGYIVGTDAPLFAEGKYTGSFSDVSVAFDSPAYQNFEENFYVNVINDVEKLKEIDAEAYDILKKAEIASSLLCLGIRDGKVREVVAYDVFNRKRKWSDTDIDSLSMLGSCIISIMQKDC